MTKKILFPGQEVTYNGEKGIIKSIKNNTAYIVFNCAEDWDNYDNYTAAGCDVSKVQIGWLQE